jgi:hypothetical protein
LKAVEADYVKATDVEEKILPLRNTVDIVDVNVALCMSDMIHSISYRTREDGKDILSILFVQFLAYFASDFCSLCYLPHDKCLLVYA